MPDSGRTATIITRIPDIADGTGTWVSVSVQVGTVKTMDTMGAEASMAMVDEETVNRTEAAMVTGALAAEDIDNIYVSFKIPWQHHKMLLGNPFI